jgi:hypothetical protein
MERESPGSDVFFLHGIGDELLGEFGGLPMSDKPADDIAARGCLIVQTPKRLP